MHEMKPLLLIDEEGEVVLSLTDGHTSRNEESRYSKEPSKEPKLHSLRVKM